MTSDPSVPPDLPPSASGKGVPPDPVATPGEYLVKPESAVKFTRAAALWSALVSMGCDFGQGYWFARPLVAASVGEFLRTATTNDVRVEPGPPAAVTARDPLRIAHGR